MEQFSEEIKKVLGDWEIVRHLGAGKYGRVYEIQRMDFGTLYRAALKVIKIPQSTEEVKEIRAAGMNNEEISNYFKGVVEDFVREFALMAKLKGHTNIVGYEDHHVIPAENGIGWTILIRMELLTSLINYVSENRITRRDVIRLGIDLCRALEVCQRVNVIHRDIKPANIFVSEMGEYKLGDFGVARIVDNTMSGRTGTDFYMAPEVYYEEKYGPSADIYSLGIVMYRLLNSNRAPFLPLPPKPVTYRDNAEAFRKRINGEALPMPSQADGRLAEIVLKACAYRAVDRYSSPVAMRKDLEAILYDENEAKEIYPEGDGVSDREGLSTNGTVPLKHHKRSAEPEQKQTDFEAKKPKKEVSADDEIDEQKKDVSPDVKMKEQQEEEHPDTKAKAQKEEILPDIEIEEQKKNGEASGGDSGKDGEQRSASNDRNDQKNRGNDGSEDTRIIRKRSLNIPEHKRKEEREEKPEAEETEKTKQEEPEEEIERRQLGLKEPGWKETEKTEREEPGPKGTESIKQEEPRPKETEKMKQEEPESEEMKEIERGEAERREVGSEESEKDQPEPEKPNPKETEPGDTGKRKQEERSEEKPQKNKKLFFLLPVIAAVMAGAVFCFQKPDTTAAIPNVCGMTYAEAESRLQEEGFAAKLQREYSDAVQKDIVISQDIGEGEEQEKGSVITLTVSDGEEPVPETEKVLVEIPDVRTKKKKAATEELEGLGFTVTLQEEYSNEPVNTVVSQSPEAGAKVQGQQDILLTVSKKRPDIKGMTCEEAFHMLNAEGFEVTEVKGKSSRKAKRNTILGADYRIGEKKEAVLTLNCIQVPDISQMKEDEAVAVLTAAGFLEEDISRESEYNSEVEAGVVLEYQVQEEDWTALAGIPDGLTLTLLEGQVPQGAKIALTVSLGAKPKESTGSGAGSYTPAAPSYTPPVQSQPVQPQPAPKKEEGPVFSDGDGRVVN